MLNPIRPTERRITYLKIDTTLKKIARIYFLSYDKVNFTKKKFLGLYFFAFSVTSGKFGNNSPRNSNLFVKW